MSGLIAHCIYQKAKNALPVRGFTILIAASITILAIWAGQSSAYGGTLGASASWVNDPAFGEFGSAAGRIEIAQDVEIGDPRFSVESFDDAVNIAPHFIEALIGEGIVTLIDQSHDRQERRELFRETFRRSFATNEIGRLIIGRHWNTASDEEKLAFLEALGGIIADTLLLNFRSGQFEIRAARAIVDVPQGGQRIIVNTIFVSENISVAVPWTVTVADGELKVLDIVVFGSSYLLTRKDEFAETLRRNGGSLTGLIADMDG